MASRLSTSVPASPSTSPFNWPESIKTSSPAPPDKSPVCAVETMKVSTPVPPWIFSKLENSMRRAANPYSSVAASVHVATPSRPVSISPASEPAIRLLIPLKAMFALPTTATVPPKPLPSGVPLKLAINCALYADKSKVSKPPPPSTSPLMLPPESKIKRSTAVPMPSSLSMLANIRLPAPAP